MVDVERILGYEKPGMVPLASTSHRRADDGWTDARQTAAVRASLSS